MTASDRYVLKPLTNETGKRGYRLEIDEFLLDNEMTNLFLIALTEMQKNSLRFYKDNEPDWLTYYSLGGIHGSPRDAWNGYPNNDPDLSYGYCHHSMNTFPTWHRPYMFQYEAAVHAEMVKQAELYTKQADKDRYLAAAARFRLPYWDLIMPRNAPKTPPGSQKPDPRTIWGCPDILKNSKVYVKLPKPNSQTDLHGFNSIDNPLATFVFPTADEFKNHPERIQLEMDEIYNQRQTTRIPTVRSKQRSDNELVDRAIQRQAGAAATMLWQMLNPDEKGTSLDKGKQQVTILINQERSWETFANDTVFNDTIRGNKFATVSLESFHDNVHVLLGTGGGWKEQLQPGDKPRGSSPYAGQIGNPAFAAYDPIFWLHHNNIERLLALYQGLYYKWVGPAEASTELFPFMTGNGRTCYKSTDDLIKDYWNDGFAIPGDTKLDPAAVRVKVKEYLTKAYYWATNSPIKPGSLEGWPKVLTGSWALHGANAKIEKEPALEMNALTVKAGVTELVARSVPLKAETLTVQDHVIPESQVLQAAHAEDQNLPRGALTGVPSITEPPVQVTWNAHVKVRKFAFNGSFSIHFFIGHVKDDQPERYMTKKNEAGFTGIFASSSDSNCASCSRNRAQDILVEDVVPLTPALYDYLDASPGSGGLIRDGNKKTIRDFTPAEVEPFLKEHLKWRIIDLRSQLLVDQEQQAQLEVTVASRQFLPPNDGALMGVYGPPTAYPDITSQKPGGLGYVS